MKLVRNNSEMLRCQVIYDQPSLVLHSKYYIKVKMKFLEVLK